MEETTIKYENCEEIYIGQGDVPNPLKEGSSSYEKNMKRSYNEFGGGGIGGGASGGMGNGHNFPAHTNFHTQMHHTHFYAPPQHPLPTPIKPDLLLQDMAAAPRKRYRRGDKNILFGPPFFELQQDFDSVDARSSLAARCLSCHVVLRGHKNVSSNFLKHMKRVHPEVYKIYENIKLLKFGAVKTSSVMPTVAMMTPNDGLNSSTETVVAPDPLNHQYFDASAFLEHMSSTAGGDDACPSETTENSGTPPTSTEAIETPENSRESQQQIPSRQPVAVPEDDEITVADVVSLPKCEDDEPKNDLTLLKSLGKKMSHMLDAKLKSYVTKIEFNETTQIVANLVERRVAQKIATSGDQVQNNSENEESKTTALQKELNALKQQLREHTQQAQQSKRQLHRELEAADRELRRNKLIIRNLVVANSEKPLEAVEQLLSERLELPGVAVSSAIIITRSKAQTQHRQTLLVELKNANDAREIFKKCFKLKNSGIFIETEMSPYARKRKEKLLVLRKEMLRRNAELTVKVQGTQLSVCGQQFYWDEVTGLTIGGSKAKDMSDLSATEYLKTLSGLDLKEFLNVLQNYDVQIR